MVTDEKTWDASDEVEVLDWYGLASVGDRFGECEYDPLGVIAQMRREMPISTNDILLFFATANHILNIFCQQNGIMS